jgi:hypothetical protein
MSDTKNGRVTNLAGYFNDDQYGRDDWNLRLSSSICQYHGPPHHGPPHQGCAYKHRNSLSILMLQTVSNGLTSSSVAASRIAERDLIDTSEGQPAPSGNCTRHE